MTFTQSELIGLVGAWLWPFARIAGVVSTAPVFGNRTVPVRVKLGLALALTMLIAPVIPQPPAVDPLSVRGMFITGQQVLIGIAIGFSARLAFAVLELAGQQIAQLMGLGFASMIDPHSGVNVPVVSQFYILLGTLVFLSLDGHLVLVEVLAHSFTSLPIGSGGIGAAGFWALAGQAEWIFAAGLAMALPAMAALLTVNLGFGVITKTAPQLNIFVVGFPISLLFGFIIMLATLPLILDRFGALLDERAGTLLTLIGGGP